MKKIINIVKIGILIIVVLFTFQFVNNLFITETDKWADFYSYDKNTIDILHMGSSHNFRSLVPMIIDKELEVDAYSIGMGGTRLQQIRYMLEECLKYQKPKIVTIEMFSINEYYVEDYAPSIVHRAFDTMRLSKTKIDGINYNVTDNNKLDYFFPITTYHLKWKDEKIKRFISDSISKKDNYSPYSGYFPRKGLYSFVEGDRNYISESSDEKINTLDAQMQESLNRIVDLCRENDIKLIFVVVPFVNQADMDAQRLSFMVNELMPFAKENDIDVVNYNYLLDELNFDNTDLNDPGHLNMDGAVKVTTHFADYLRDNYSDLLSDCNWDYEEVSKKDYINFVGEYEDFLNKKKSLLDEQKLNLLGYENNLAEYLSLLDSEKHIIIISTKNSGLEHADDYIVNNLMELGLTLDINFSSEKKQNYAAIINGEYIYEKSSKSRIYIEKGSDIEKEMELPFRLKVVSSSESTGNSSVIGINGENYSKNKTGLNIVVYDKYLKRVVSSASFNLDSGEHHYYNRNTANEKYNQDAIIYSLDMNTIADNLMGASSTIDKSIGTLIHAQGDNARFSLIDYQHDSNHIIVRAEIECSNATVFQIEFNDMLERVQLVSGYNDIYIEINLDEIITDLKIHPADSPGEYIIKNIEICDISQ